MLVRTTPSFRREGVRMLRRNTSVVIHARVHRLLRSARRGAADVAARMPVVSPTAADSWSQGGSQAVSSVVELLQFGAFVALVTRYLVNITQCSGPSMLPTIGTAGDVLLTVPLHLHRWLGAERPKLGDVVISISPTDPTQTVCKRVMGLPGDTVRAGAPPGWPADYAREVVVPRGHVWLQGDNLSDSTDSRSYGPVPLALVQGVVVGKLYPFNTAGRLSSLPADRSIRLSPQEVDQRRQGRRRDSQRAKPSAVLTHTAAQSPPPKTTVPAHIAVQEKLESTRAAPKASYTAIKLSVAVTEQLASLMPLLLDEARRNPAERDLLQAATEVQEAASDVERALRTASPPVIGEMSGAA